MVETAPPAGLLAIKDVCGVDSFTAQGYVAVQKSGLIRVDGIQTGVVQTEGVKDLLLHDLDVGLVPQRLEEDTECEVIRIGVLEGPDIGRGPGEGPC